jgi:predicted enzyme related to lactoylglutathione lyase
MNIRRIVPDLTVTDVEACKNFYIDILGLELGMDLGWVITLGSPNNPTAQLTLIQKDQTAPLNPQITIEVEDVTAVFNNALKAGTQIVYPLTEEPWGVRRFFMTDPNGVVINVMSHCVSKL